MRGIFEQKVTVVCVVLLGTMLAVPGLAKEKPWVPASISRAGGSSYDTGEGHHAGLMLRYTIGGSYAHTRWSSGETLLGEKTRTNTHGAALDMEGAIGYALSPNLAVHLTVAYWKVFKPTGTTITGDSKTSISADDGSVSNFGIGAGVTGWFVNNIFVTGSLLADRIHLRAGDNFVANSDWGFGMSLAAGKEWWVAPHVGVGLALAATIHVIPTKDKGNTTIFGEPQKTPPVFGYTIGPRLTITIN